MLASWLEQDPANREAFEQMSGVWDHLGQLAPAFAPEEKQFLPKGLTHQRDAERKTGLKRLFNRLLKPDKHMAVACISLAMIVFFCLPVLKTQLDEPVRTVHSYTTATGEQKTITLSDGSLLKMNVSSSITVCMGKGYRRVQMNNGEVFFDVSPDPGRPFEVLTSTGLVRVLGTAFNVRDRNGLMAVDVDRGNVQVQSAPKGPGDMRIETVTLFSGQGADINSSGRLAPVRNCNIQQVIAWQQHQVVFKNTPVSRVVRELALYHNAGIEFADQDLGKKRVTGTFDMQNLEQTLAIIAIAASLKVEKQTNGTIALSGEPVAKNEG